MASLTGSMVNVSTPVMRRTKAKQDTVDKICKIVRKQLAIPDETPITGESKFSELGADSLDIVDIMMGLEESFYISVDLESAQDIATVKDAAEMIQKLIP